VALGEAYYERARILARAGDRHQALEYGRRAVGYGNREAVAFLESLAAPGK
jgi:hypothetical protein